MMDAARSQESLEALKALNNAVVAIRVYPPHSPQLKTAVERGYKMVKQYIHLYDVFSIAFQNSEYLLCGEPLSREIVQTIPNLVLYRQLQLLDTDQLTMLSGLDRNVFKQLLIVLSAKVDKIKQYGGGREIIRKLGIDACFSDIAVEAVSKNEASSSALFPDVSPRLLHVKKEYAEYLFSAVPNKSIARILEDMFVNPQEGGRLLASCVALVIHEYHKKKQIGQSAVLEHCFRKCESLIAQEHKGTVVQIASRLLLDNCSSAFLSNIFFQKSDLELASALMGSLVQMMTIEQFTEIIGLLNTRYGQVQIKDEDDRRSGLLASAMRKLLSTSKGKQYISLEKTKKLMQEGEKERRLKRTETGLTSLIQGNLVALQSDELVAALPDSVKKLEKEERSTEIDALLLHLTQYVKEQQPHLSEGLEHSLALICEDLAERVQWNQLAILVEALILCITLTDRGGVVLEKIVSALNQFAQWSFANNKAEVGDTILLLFHRIRSGQMKKLPAVQAVISRIQDRSVDRQMMQQLLQSSLKSPMDEQLSRRLVLYGPVAATFLVDMLVRQEEKADRIKIIDLLTSGQQYLPPILVQKLAEPMPWFGKRNILKLLAESGGPEHLDAVYPYICHEDFRIQREAFLCVYKISGEKRKAALLHILNIAGEMLKVQIVKALQPYTDMQVVAVLQQIIADREHYSPQVRDELLTNAMQAIGRCGNSEALQYLQEFMDLKDKRNGKNLGPAVWEAVDKSIKNIQNLQLEEKRRHVLANQIRKTALRKISQPSQQQTAEGSRLANVSIDEEQINALLAAGDRAQATHRILSLIEQATRQRRFTQADQLKDWLARIDPNNLSAIIKAGEIIDAEKKASIDKSHLEVWSGLYDRLSTEEFTTFYHALVHRSFNDEELLAKKGDIQNSLYFINSGKVKLFYREKGSDFLVKTMGKGEVLGSGTFFDISSWTVSASCIGKTEISMLNFETMQLWRESFPDLEAKLREFCMRFETIAEFFANSANDRRKSERFKVNGLVTMSILGSDGSITGVSSRGPLIDISSGGLSFNLRITNKGNARLLLGRSIRMDISKGRDEAVVSSISGQIVAVRALHTVELEYSVHAQFSEKIEKNVLHSIFADLKHK